MTIVACTPLAVAATFSGVALTAGLLGAAVLIATWVYLDSRARFGKDVAALISVAVGGLLVAGSLPGLVALAVADETAVQGFPTALRIVPGIVAVAVYLYARRNSGAY